MNILEVEFPNTPMRYICNEVQDMLTDFINREAKYIYAPYNKRRLFTLEDKDDYLRNSTLSIDEYIVKYNLEYKWKRQNIKDNFSYKQQKRFEKSGLSLDEYIEKNNLYTSSITSDKNDNLCEIDILSYSSDDNNDYDDYDNDYDNNDYDDYDNDYDNDYDDNSWGE